MVHAKKYAVVLLSFVLILALLVGNVLPVSAAEESYKTVEFNARNNWNDGAGYTEFLATYYLPSDAQMFAFRLGDDETGTAFRDRNLHIVVMDNTVDFDIVDYDCVYSEIMWKYGSVIGENYNSPSIYTMSKTRLLEHLYDEASSTSHSPYWGFAQRINEYTFPFPVFDSVAGFIAYLETGDTSGIENYEDIMQGPTLPTPDQSNDDILNGIWGGVTDSEVAYEEDDGTVIDAIRTAFRNVVNGITSPIRTVHALIKLLPSALLGVLQGSNIGTWLKGLYDASVSFPVAVLEAIIDSELYQKIEGMLDALVSVPVSIIDEFLASDLFARIVGMSEGITALPSRLLELFQKGDLGAWIKGLYGAVLGLPEVFLDEVIERLKYWFIPTVDDWERHFEAFDLFARDKLGFLYYVFDAAGDLINSYLFVEASSTLTVPGYTMNIAGTDYTIWNPIEIDMDQTDVFKYVRMFTSFLQACGIWNLAGMLWDDLIAGGKK